MRISLLLIALLVLAPVTQAGTAEAPEVPDPTGDGFDYDPESARDLTAGWVEYVAEEGVFRFHATLAADPTHVFASVNAGSEIIRFGFRSSGLELEEAQESYVRIRFAASTGTGNAGDEIATCRYGVAAEDKYQDIKLQKDLTAGFEGAHFWCDVPQADLGHQPNGTTTLSKLHLDAHWIQRGPLSGDSCVGAVCAPVGGDLGGVNEVAHYDRAPDSGYGTDFVIAPPAPAAGNETAPDGNTTGNAAGNATGNQTAPGGNPPGTPATPGDDCPDSAGCEADNEGGNETVDDTPAAKESPGVALPMVLAMLGAVAAVRLRRS